MRIHMAGDGALYFGNWSGATGWHKRWVLCRTTDLIGGAPDFVHTDKPQDVTCWQCLKRMAEKVAVPA